MIVTYLSKVGASGLYSITSAIHKGDVDATELALILNWAIYRKGRTGLSGGSVVSKNRTGKSEMSWDKEATIRYR